MVDESNEIQGMWDPGRSEKSVFPEGVMSSTNCPPTIQGKRTSRVHPLRATWSVSPYTEWVPPGILPIYPYCQRRQWHPTPVLMPGKSHGWRSLVATVHGVAKSRTQLSDFTFTFHFHALEKETATYSSVLAWRIPGTGEPGGLLSIGRTESDTTEAI